MILNKIKSCHLIDSISSCRLLVADFHWFLHLLCLVNTIIAILLSLKAFLCWHAFAILTVPWYEKRSYTEVWHICTVFVVAQQWQEWGRGKKRLAFGSGKGGLTLLNHNTSWAAIWFWISYSQHEECWISARDQVRKCSFIKTVGWHSNERHCIKTHNSTWQRFSKIYGSQY